MKNRALNISTYTFQKDEPLLLDANVWLYLYAPPTKGGTSWATPYSAALKNMRSAGSRLVMDVLVLSEYLNGYCRIEWNALHKARYQYYKDFRRSTDFVPVGQGAATFAGAILKLCGRCDHAFVAADVTRILAEFESGACDFNDGMLADACRHNGWKLVTNDADFTIGGIEILTSNPALLRACQ